MSNCPFKCDKGECGSKIVCDKNCSCTCPGTPLIYGTPYTLFMPVWDGWYGLMDQNLNPGTAGDGGTTPSSIITIKPWITNKKDGDIIMSDDIVELWVGDQQFGISPMKAEGKDIYMVLSAGPLINKYKSITSTKFKFHTDESKCLLQGQTLDIHMIDNTGTIIPIPNDVKSGQHIFYGWTSLDAKSSQMQIYNSKGKIDVNSPISMCNDKIKCLNDYTCVSGTCVSSTTKKCTNDSICGELEHCVGGFCVNRVKCVQNQNCPSGQNCVKELGVCYSSDIPACSTDVECKKINSTCIHGACLGPPPPADITPKPFPWIYAADIVIVLTIATLLLLLWKAGLSPVTYKVIVGSIVILIFVLLWLLAKNSFSE